MKSKKIISPLFAFLIFNGCFFQPKKDAPKVEVRKDLRVLFAGDVMLDWGISDVIEKNGYKYPFEDIKEFLKQFDYRFCNLECPVSEEGEPHPDKKYIFLGKPEYIETLKYGDINGVSLANNHSNDFGKTALLNTLTNLYTNGISFTGAGMNIGSAHLPISIDIKNVRLAVFAYSVIANDDSFATDSTPGIAGFSLDLIKEDIEQFRRLHDFIIISIHWGNEYSRYPTEKQIEMAHAIIDAGADVIIGHHPHIFQGIEIYKKKPIFYSLGNFIFGSINEDIRDNVLLEVSFLKEGIAYFSVFPINGNKNTRTPFRSQILKGPTAGRILKHLINISRQLGKDFPGRVVAEDSHLKYYFGKKKIKQDYRIKKD